MRSIDELSKIVFYEMASVHQITIDLVQDVEELVNEDLPETSNELCDQLTGLGAKSYDIGLILEIFDPQYEKEIDILKDLRTLLQLREGKMNQWNLNLFDHPPKANSAMITFNGVEITEEDMLKSRQHHIEILEGCIKDVESGEVRVNDPDQYIHWKRESIIKIERGDSDHTFTLLQTALYLKTGECVPLLTKSKQ